MKQIIVVLDSLLSRLKLFFGWPNKRPDSSEIFEFLAFVRLSTAVALSSLLLGLLSSLLLPFLLLGLLLPLPPFVFLMLSFLLLILSILDLFLLLPFALFIFELFAQGSINLFLQPTPDTICLELQLCNPLSRLELLSLLLLQALLFILSTPDLRFFYLLSHILLPLALLSLLLLLQPFFFLPLHIQPAPYLRDGGVIGHQHVIGEFTEVGAHLLSNGKDSRRKKLDENLEDPEK